MANISRLVQFVNGVARGVDLSSNTLVVGSLTIGASTLTSSILANLISYGQGAIDSLTGDVTASGPGAAAATVAKIQGTTVSGTTGTGNVAFSASPTFTGTVTAAAVSLSGTLNMNGGVISNLATPTSVSSPTQAATKAYVDNAINGLSWKTAVTVATTAALPAYTFSVGSPAGTGDTLTGSSTGALVIDGHTTALNDRILVKDETGANAPYNGIWVVTTAGAVGTAYVLTRATDMETWAEVPASAVFVEQGSTNIDLGFVCTSQPGGTMDTTNISFVQFSSAGAYSAGSGLTLTSGVFAVDVDNVTIDVNGSNQVEVKSGGIGTTQLASAAVTPAKLGSITDSVTLDQLGTGSTLEIKAGGVGTTQLAAAAVTAAKLGSVTDGVTLDQAGAGSTIEIKSGGVGTTQLAAAAVTAAKLGSVTDGITLDQGGAGSTIEIKAAGVSATQLATGAFDQKTITGGSGTPAAVAYAPAVEVTAVYGGAATLVANTTYALRWGLVANGETAGKLYVADWDTTSFDLFWVVGLYNSGTTTATGTTITVVNKGLVTLGSSDTTFGTVGAPSNDVGEPVWLGASGAYSANSGFSPSAGNASAKLGVAKAYNQIWVDYQMMGVN